MTMDFTETMLKEVEDLASLMAAERCQIENVLDLNVEKRLEAIQSKSPNLGNAIKQFFNSQRSWHKFHLKINDEGKQNALDAQASSEQVEQSNNFESSRKAFLVAMNSYNGELG